MRDSVRDTRDKVDWKCKNCTREICENNIHCIADIPEHFCDQYAKIIFANGIAQYKECQMCGKVFSCGE